MAAARADRPPRPASDLQEQPWPRSLDPSSVDRVLVVFSDVELGAGGPTDDFPQSDYLGKLIESYNTPPFAEVPVTVVFNGDTFDLLKTSYQGSYPTRINADVAVGKMMRVAAAHLGFFECLRRFLHHPPAARQICWLTGNHDLELLFPEVQALVKTLTSDGVSFPGHALRVGDVHIEHGFQADPLFTIDESEPFVEHDGDTLLNLPWGAVALLEVAIPLAPLLCSLDRVRPRERMLEELPEVRDLLLGSFWRYWTRDYWRDYFADVDPLKKLSWTMLREVVYRFGSRHPDVSLGDYYQRLLQRDDALHLCVVGHQHEPAWWSHDQNKVLRTGCFRNEFVLGPDGYRLLPKVYAEAYLKGERVVRSHLVEVNAPDPPDGYMPASIFELRPLAEEMLERQRHDVAGERAAQAKQEAREARDTERMDDDGFAFIRTLRRALKRDDD